MDKGRALRLLRLKSDATDEQIRKRAAHLMRQAHPDHGGDPATAGKIIGELRSARKALLSARRRDTKPEEKKVCTRCHGRGTLHAGGFSQVTCPVCHGEGVIYG